MWIGVFDPVLRKIKGYEYESEMRLFFWNTAGISAAGVYVPHQLPKGVTFTFSPSEMIDAIWIGPRGTARTLSMVETLVAQYNLDVPIRVSSKMSTNRPITYRRRAQEDPSPATGKAGSIPKRRYCTQKCYAGNPD